MIGLLISLACSACAGYIASVLMGLKGPWYQYLGLGLVGGFVGAIVFSFIGLAASNTLGQALISVAGACLVIFLWKLLKK